MKNKPVYLKNFKDFKDKFGELKKQAVLFVGPPGCGKGTQASLLAKETGWIHISTGEILRGSKNEEIKELMKSGKLLPDEIVGQELDRFLTDHKKAKGFIFDGYPRNLSQKPIFEEILKSHQIELIKIFYLNVPEKTLKSRIEDRAKDSGRSDDKDPEVFKVRMKEYKEQTLPLIISLETADNFIEIDGEQSLEEIKNKIRKEITK